MTPQKRVKRQSSKPLFGWLQKKLGGSSRTSGQPVREQRPRAATLPQLEIPSRTSEGGVFTYDDDISHIGRSTYPRSSRSSMWSPSHAETADDDASIRPLPPTSPPSPSPSRSSSSYLSDPRTFKSVTASTKPTTLISIDLGTNGMAHIAQAPPTPINTNPPSAMPRFSTSSISVSNSTSITFSSLSPNPAATLSPNNVQAPLHTAHHPRYNPRPSSPPQDNASLLTLASSAFGFPGARLGNWMGDSQSQFAIEYSSQHGEQEAEGTEETEETEEGQAEDASVRALRPRSSRRNSWESELSGWSARLLARERSMRTSSFRVGDGDSEAGEEAEAPDTKSKPGPSPLSVDVFSTEAKTTTVQETELKAPELTETEDEGTLSPSRQVQTGEPERTPTKKTMVDINVDADCDVTEKMPPLSTGTEPGEARRRSGEAKAEAGEA
ncbi:hypothetical protein M422DRAFT_238148 [Sphaerobolus stellatus SS14]|nr:hypothetical protein M422DRAFT_238148 [Sphaerobolus stellatus SS14]